VSYDGRRIVDRDAAFTLCPKLPALFPFEQVFGERVDPLVFAIGFRALVKMQLAQIVPQGAEAAVQSHAKSSVKSIAGLSHKARRAASLGARPDKRARAIASPTFSPAA